MKLTIHELASILDGLLSQGDGAREISYNVSTDTRTLKEGDVFFALQGENFDGNQYAVKAASLGAAVVVTSQEQKDVSLSCAQIVVKDTLEALQSWAKSYRERFAHLRPVAITGSNGKTSTKDFLKSILNQRGHCCATKGNLNNHIGLPLSVLSLTEDDTTAVWEMGMNHPGELAPLCTIAQPRISIVTSVGVTHIEFMKSREGIADEKATVARCLPEEGYFLMPVCDDFFSYVSQQTKGHVIPVGGIDSPVRAENVVPTEYGYRFQLVIKGKGCCAVELPVPGQHMLTNALLAAGAASLLDYSLEEIAAGLQVSELTQGRLQKKQFGSVTVLDDTYNANPDSMVAALRALDQMEKRSASAKKIAVLGVMGELGSYSEEGHRSVGKACAQFDLDVLVAVGKDARWIAEEAEACSSVKVFTVDDRAQAHEVLSTLVGEQDILLFKGSRSARMELLISTLFLEKSL